MSKLFIAICLSLLVLFVGYGSKNGAVVAQRTDTSRFLIGILRLDGVLVPFAQYSKGVWSNPWPKPDSYSEEDLNTLADLKSPWFAHDRRSLTTWYFWSSNALTVLKTSKTVRVENHCQTNWGLLSDFPKETTEDSHHRKVGVVLTVKQKIEGMVELANESTEWSSVISFIRPTFERVERIEIAKVGAPSPTNYFPPDEDRKKIGLTMIHLYRNKSKINGQRVYYFEAGKQFLKPASSTDQGCNNISFFQGWVLENMQGKLNLLDHRLVLTDCDMKEGSSTLPLGILTMKNRVFVIVQNHGYEDESYSILELRGSGIHHVIETAAGGC